MGEEEAAGGKGAGFLGDVEGERAFLDLRERDSSRPCDPRAGVEVGRN